MARRPILSLICIAALTATTQGADSEHEQQLFHPATINLSINGGEPSEYHNPAEPTASLDWKLFTVTFTAETDLTSIAFLNGSEEFNYNSALDNISITDAPLAAAVPEPASLAIWGLGALGLCVAGRRRKQSA